MIVENDFEEVRLELTNSPRMKHSSKSSHYVDLVIPESLLKMPLKEVEVEDEPIEMEALDASIKKPRSQFYTIEISPD